MPVPRLIVFDLDGTLIDSSTDLAAATNRLVGELGGRALTQAEVVGMVGEGAAVLVRRALAASGLDPARPGALDRFLEIYEGHLLEHTRPYAGMVDVLDALLPMTALAVLTNKPQAASEAILDGLDLRRYFTAVIGGDTAFGRKPLPDGLAHLAAAANAPTGETMLVGDSPVDLETARRAGSRICLARYGFGFRFPPGSLRGDELLIDRPGELLALLQD
jgi:phosphoglycolate phosphatase